MTAVMVTVYVLCLIAALLGGYAVMRDLSADLVLLGAAALVLLAWLVETAILAATDVGGSVAAPPDRILLYGYLASGLAVGIASVYIGLTERSRWGSAAVLLCSVTIAVLQLRMPQLWAGAFA